MKTMSQRLNLFNLCLSIMFRKSPLGVGLHNQCWAGLAIEKAREKNVLTVDFYGLSMKQIKKAIKQNNILPPYARNIVMIFKTFIHAIS